MTAAEMREIGSLLPDREPVLCEPPQEPGSPRRALRVCEPLLDGNELNYVTECIRSNWVSSGGPFVARFEERFAAAAGCEYGVACSSGTAALHLALAAQGLGPGDEVILPTFTMIATANAILYTGAEPIVVDAAADDWNIDVAQIEAKITPRTKCIVVVHTYGQPAPMDSVLDIARRRRLTVIEDSAEAHGAEYRGRPVGSLGDAGTFSFYGNKIVTTGEGGMVTTNDPELARMARSLRDHAFSSERHFWHEYLGFNYRLTNLQAAVGLAQTERLSELVERRRALRTQYDAGLRNVAGISVPTEMPDTKNVFWMYTILVHEAEFGCSRDELRRKLARRGIETRTAFIPIHLQPVYFHRFSNQRFPVAELLCRQGMYLPSGPTLKESDVEYVLRSIREPLK